MAFELNRDLLQRASAGDHDALHTLVEELRPHVVKQLQRYPVSDDDRLDLVQMTLMQIMRRIGSFRGDSSFSTWLFRVTANEALMLMRSQRRHRARIADGVELGDVSLAQHEAFVHHEDGESTLVQKRRERAMSAALAKLPKDYRDVVIAHYHQDLGLHEIAARFSMTESAVRSRLHRARGKLRELLESNALGADLDATAAA
jgi:RNA polymerase sigma-70 factor (ECF subfamily)